MVEHECLQLGLGEDCFNHCLAKINLDCVTLFIPRLHVNA